MVIGLIVGVCIFCGFVWFGVSWGVCVRIGLCGWRCFGVGCGRLLLCVRFCVFWLVF